jgi:hypothetical protein
MSTPAHFNASDPVPIHNALQSNTSALGEMVLFSLFRFFQSARQRSITSQHIIVSLYRYLKRGT